MSEKDKKPVVDKEPEAARSYDIKTGTYTQYGADGAACGASAWLHVWS